MPRWLVWLPVGVVLLAVAIAAPLFRGAAEGPAARRSAPRVVIRDLPAPAHGAARSLEGPGAPEVVFLGDWAPAPRGRVSAPAPLPVSRRRVVHEIVYVDAPGVEGAPSAPSSMETPSEPATEPPTVVPAGDPAPIVPPPTVPATRGSSRAGDIVTGAAIGAGIGAVLGGGRGALRGAVGGAAAGAIGGRSGAVLGGVLGGASGRRAPRAGGCFVEPGQDLVSTTPGIGATP